MSELLLEDMTKDELIWVFKQSMFVIGSHYKRLLVDARIKSIRDKAEATVNAALKKSEENIHNPKIWFEAQKEFDKGMKMHEEADALMGL